MRTRMMVTGGVIAAGGGAIAYSAYRRDLKAAKQRIHERRQFVESPQGPIEFAESGDGPAVLMVHGAGGGFDQGLDLGRVFLGDHYRIVAPSRFGYLGTPLPDDASAEAQADAHLRLLDALELETVPVIGVSAGAPSAMQLCLRHPERCAALVLVVPLAYAPQHDNTPRRSTIFTAVLRAVAGSDLVFWVATKVARNTLLETILGTPVEDYRRASVTDRRAVDETLRSILPISSRTVGIANDGNVATNLEPYALEEMRVPTLVVSTADDQYGTYESALYTAAHIPDARFVGFPRGGHLLVGHDSELRWQVTSFVEAHARVTASV